MLGVLGLGSHSTKYFINLLNEKYYKDKGGFATKPFLMLNANFNDINPHLPFEFEAIEKGLKPWLDQLRSYDVDQILLPNITLNFAGYFMSKELFKNVLNPFDLLIEKLEEEQKDKITFLGTRHMTQNDLMTEFFAKHKITLLSMSDSLRADLDVLRSEVYREGIGERKVKSFGQILDEVENPVIGCTELSILNLGQGIDLLELMVSKS